jgi:hypothetical protein
MRSQREHGLKMKCFTPRKTFHSKPRRHFRRNLFLRAFKFKLHIFHMIEIAFVRIFENFCIMLAWKTYRSYDDICLIKRRKLKYDL